MSDDEPLIIDSGPVVLQAATFKQNDQQEEVVGDGGDRAGTGEQAA